ncbi:MAG: inositol monophosphatase, partial [Chloroflexi bacterium]|nr:inositol monophosphatase [Chloroflexota bacterium]
MGTVDPMTTAAPDPIALLALAEATAREAGALLLDGFEGVRTVDAKSSPTDVVTEMDRAAEALIVRRIMEARPDDGILGEEGTDRPSGTGVRWVIDPLDGTVNYLYRRPDWAVSIAAEVDGVVVAGAVFAPVPDECFTASLGGSATLNGRPLHPSAETRLGHALCGTGFSYDQSDRKVQGAILARVVSEVRDIRRAGSAALDLCAVAYGRLDVYFERGLQPWDGAAAGLVLREAGGRCETLDDAPEPNRR